MLLGLENRREDAQEGVSVMSAVLSAGWAVGSPCEFKDNGVSGGAHTGVRARLFVGLVGRDLSGPVPGSVCMKASALKGEEGWVSLEGVGRGA